MRYPMRIDPWWAPVLLLIGVTPGRAYVALGRDRLLVRFGVFSYRVARNRVAAARRTAGPWWFGIGIHANLLNALIVNGSLAGLVELTLAPPAWWWVLCVPVRCRHLYLSVADPDAFLTALGPVASGPAPVGALAPRGAAQ